MKEPTHLGGDIDAAGMISDAGCDRVVESISRAWVAAGRCEIDSFYAFVTAAIRDAPNREGVLDRIETTLGVRPQFLTSAQEARLTYLAVRHWYGWRAGTLLILDIGGGSMEVALGRDAEPDLALSLPLGARRLTRAFLTADPPARDELKALRRHIRDCLKHVRDRLSWESQPHLTVGSSKTFKQLARLSGAAPRREGPFVERRLEHRHVRAAARRLAELSTDERAGLPGISPSRAPHVLAGAMVADSAMTELGIPVLAISPWALREGVVLHHISTVSDTPSALPLTPFTPSADTPPAQIIAMQRRAGVRHRAP